MDNETTSVPFEFSLDEWNNQLAEVLIPNNIILSLYVLMGIVGNGMIIFVYGFRMKGKKDDRYFIPFLAAVDLFTSSVCASFGIVTNLLQVKLRNTYLCKALWYFGTVGTVMSAQMLLIIAVQRYRKICKPLGLQMTLMWKRIALGISFGVAVIVSGPMVYFYGSVPFPNKNGTMIGLSCNIIKDRGEIEWILYLGIFGILAVGISTSLIIIYTKIGYKIYSHFKTFKRSRKNSKKDNKSNNGDCELNACSSNSNSPFTETASSTLNSDQVSTENSSVIRKNPEENIQNEKKKNKYEQQFTKPITSSHEARNKRIMYKFTAMFMLVTAVFLVCYIPKLILMYFEGINTTFWEQFSESQRAGVLFIYRMYIVNNIVNPVIYGFMDNEFRAELWKLCSCWKT